MGIEYVYFLYESDQWMSNSKNVLMGVFTTEAALSEGAMQLVREKAEENYEQELANGCDDCGIEDFIEDCHRELLENFQYSGAHSFLIRTVEVNKLEEI